MSWAAVGPGGGVPLTGVEFGVGAGVTFAVAVGDGEKLGSSDTDGDGEPLGAVVDPRAVSNGDAEGVLEQPPRSRTSRNALDRFIVFGLRSSSSLNDGPGRLRVMPHAGSD
jgi:hypothetical protein